MRPRVAGRASHSPVKAAVYLLRAVFALLLALVRDWPAQLDDGAPTAPDPVTGCGRAGRADPWTDDRADPERRQHSSASWARSSSCCPSSRCSDGTGCARSTR